MTRLICAALLLLTFASCSKDPIGKAPESTITFTRTLTYPNRNNEVFAKTYTQVQGTESIVAINNGKLRLFFNVPASNDGSVGEGLALDLDVNTLSQALIREYGFDNAASRISYARYTYTQRTTAQSSWTSITESLAAKPFGGTLRITGFNAVHRTISGTFTITANDLMYDPMQESIATPPNPANRCNLQLTATFSDIKAL